MTNTTAQPKIISFVNQKGGCGKSTTAIQLACAFKQAGYTVAIADADPQATALSWFGASEQEDKLPVFGFAVEGTIKQVKKLPFEIVIIDTQASISKLLAEVISASDMCLIPVTPSAPDVWGSANVVELIKVRKTINPTLAAAFVITKAKAGTVLANQITDALAAYEFPVLAGTSEFEVYKQTIASGDCVYVTHHEKAKTEMTNLTNNVIDFFIQSVD